MAQEVEIFFKVDGLETYITDLNDLEEVLNQVKGATDSTAAATKNLENDIDDATKGIEESERRLNALEGGIKTLAGSFEILAGSAALLGLEDNEFFSGLEENVIGVLALSQGVIDASEGIRLLKDNTKLAAVAQRIFNTVANANPYVLLATAVIALAGAVALYTSRAKDAENQQKRLNKTFNERAQYTLDQIDFEEELLRVREELTPEKEIEFNNQRIEQINEEIRLSRQRITSAKIGDITEGEQELIDRLEENIKTRQEQAAGLRRSNILIEEGQTAEEKRLAAEKAAEDERLRIEKEEQARHERELARIEAERLAEENAANARVEIFENQAQLEDELFLESLTEEERRFRALEDQYYERLNLAEGNAELIAQVEASYAQQQIDLEAQIQKERVEGNKEANDQILANTEQFNQQLIQAEEALQQAKVNAAQQGFAVLSALAGENEELQKVIFVASQAFEAAQIAIQGTKDIAQVRSEQIKSTTQLGAQAAVLTARLAAGDLTAAPALATVQGSIAAVNAGATASIAGIKLNTAAGVAGVLAATIGQLKAAKDTGTTPPQISGVGASAPLGALPSFQTSQGEDVLIGGTRSQEVTGGGPIQAYVIASDVTTAQQANQQIENLSRL
jgi:hypothetical protein